MDLKILLLSSDGTEPALGAWKAALDREGVAYDTIIANTAAPIVASTLAVDANHARYQAVVLATGGLYQCDASGCFSALDASEWAVLNAYQTQFGVRRVTAYAYPTPDYGLNWPYSSGDLSGTSGALTAAGLTTFPYLSGTVPMDTGTYGYYAEPLAAVAPAVPFQTLVAGPVGPGGAASALVGVNTRADGFQELVITVAMNRYQLHALLLGHGLINWVTKGVHLGYTRPYLTMHIDDVLLPDDRWDMVDNKTYEDDGVKNPVIRMLPSDVNRAIAWQTAQKLQLDLVFNGGGSDEIIADTTTSFLTKKGVLKIIKGQDVLLNSLKLVKSQFNWINHTYSHENLDLLSTADIVAQVSKNVTFAINNNIAINKQELVTGEHSGLANPNMAAAAAQTNLLWLAADNSKQPDPYAIGQATTIPRYPSNVYYNVGKFAEQLDEYNYIYFENCVNTQTTTCLTAPATWADYINSEATIMLRHLLLNDPRPHYFHQSNLAEDGTFYPVIDEVLKRFHSYVNLALVQPKFADSGVILKRATAWQAALPAATAYYKNGYVYVTSPTTVSAPVSGTTNGTLYGGERSIWVSLSAGIKRSFVSAILL